MEFNRNDPAWQLRKGKCFIQSKGQDVEDFETPKNENQWERIPFQSGIIKNAGKRGRRTNQPHWWHGALTCAGFGPILKTKWSAADMHFQVEVPMPRLNRVPFGTDDEV